MRVRFQQVLIEQSNALTDVQTSQNRVASWQTSLVCPDQSISGLRLEQGDCCKASEPQPISNDMQQSSKLVNILSWNLQGYSYQKYEILKSSHIILAQEANRIDGKQGPNNFYGYQHYVKERNGQPLMTLVRKQIPSRRIHDLETQNTLVVQVFFIVCSRKNMMGTKARQIDYLMKRKNIQWQYGMTKSLSHFNNLSDHKPLTTFIMIPDKDLFKTPMINTKKLNKYLNELKQKPKNVYEYMQVCNNPTFYGIKYIDYEIIINKKFSEVIEATKALLFSKKSKEFYNIIQHSRNLKPYKKEGSIMNFIQLSNGNMVFDHKEITSMCIGDLILIQQEQIFRTCDRIPMNFTISFNKEIIKKLRSNKKAVSFDLVEFKHLVNFVYDYYQMELNFEMIASLDYLFSMRMVPLNKMHPAIPLRGQFRPIMVISHFIKMFECHYVERFKRICTDVINASQIGFVSLMGCPLHIASLVREIQSQVRKKQQGRITIFLDLSYAYNCVRRDLIFKNLRENSKFQGIFNENELYALEWIYDSLYIFDPIEQKKVYFQNGVHQGSMLASFLFDIYFDQLIEELQRKKIKKKECGEGLNIQLIKMNKGFCLC